MHRDEKSPESLSSTESSKDNSSSKNKKDKSKRSSENQESQQDQQSSVQEKRAKFFDNQKTPEKGKKNPDLRCVEAKDVEKSAETTDDEQGLSEAEAQEVTTAIIETRNTELADELGDAKDDSPEELEVLADIAFLESLREKIDGGEDLTAETIDEAFTETAQDLGIDNLNEPDNESDGEEPEKLTESEAVATDPTEENSDNLNPPTSTPPAPPLPPIPPVPGSPAIPPLPPRPSYPQPASPNYNNPSGHTANNSPNTVVHYVERRRRGRDLLVGGIVGYVIGRRGGRKRTEKKLLPKIDKLEKEVETLHDVITEHEAKIRNLARKSAETEYKLKEATHKNTEKSRSITMLENRQKRNEIKQTLKRREELASKESVEKLTKFTLPALEVFRERRLIDGTQDSPDRKRFEVMTDSELLEKMKGIAVDGLTIEEAYRSGRMNRHALLEITKSFYRKDSMDFKQVLRRELKTSPEQLEQHRQKIEQLRESNSSEAKSANTEKNVGNGSGGDIEKQRYFQRNADATQQVAPQNPVKASKNTTLVLPWIAAGVVIALLIVGYLLVSS